MKKTIFVLVILVFITSVTGVTAFAYGGGCRGQQTRYELCTVSGCETVGMHQHDGVWYCSPGVQQGGYEICTVEGCTVLGLHEHDGKYYCSASGGMGRGCGRRFYQ